MTGVGTMPNQPGGVFWTGISLLIVGGIMLTNWGCYGSLVRTEGVSFKKYLVVVSVWSFILMLLAIGTILLTQGKYWGYSSGVWVVSNQTLYDIGISFVIVGIPMFFVWIGVSTAIAMKCIWRGNDGA